MTGEDHADDGSAHDPGEIVAHALGAIADADDPTAVATIAADGAARLCAGPADCVVYDAAGDAVAAGASDGSTPSDRRDHVDVADATATLAWPADPLLVPGGDAGWLALWVEGDQQPPAWAIRTLATATVDAAHTRSRLDAATDRIATLEAERDQLGNFATIVAHDLRNPLAIAKGHLELARKHGDTEHFETIADAHDRIQQIIDRTLSVARDDDAGETERVEIAEIAHEAWETVETGAATLTVSRSLRLAADRDRLTQLFENLFRNAVEHGAPGADSQGRRDAVDPAPSEYRNEVTGTSDPAVGQGLAVEVGRLPEQTGFFVADNGPGIPTGERSSVFDQGYSENGGTGLGLAIVREVADEHGWSITVTDRAAGQAPSGTDSDPAGARFEFVVSE